MEEKEIKAEMRLWALEILSANAFAMLCALDPNQSDLLARIKRQMLDAAKQKTFPGFDAAESDVLASELEAAIKRLMEMVETQMRAGRQTPGQ